MTTTYRPPPFLDNFHYSYLKNDPSNVKLTSSDEFYVEVNGSLLIALSGLLKSVFESISGAQEDIVVCVPFPMRILMKLLNLVKGGFVNVQNNDIKYLKLTANALGIETGDWRLSEIGKIKPKCRIKSDVEDAKSHSSELNPCNICNKSFTRKDHLFRHMKTYHRLNSNEYHCDSCNVSFSRKDGLLRHGKTEMHKLNSVNSLEDQPYVDSEIEPLENMNTKSISLEDQPYVESENKSVENMNTKSLNRKGRRKRYEKKETCGKNNDSIEGKPYVEHEDKPASMLNFKLKKVANGVKPFSCEDCQIHFDKKHKLLKHRPKAKHKKYGSGIDKMNGSRIKSSENSLNAVNVGPKAMEPLSVRNIKKWNQITKSKQVQRRSARNLKSSEGGKLCSEEMPLSPEF